MSLSTIVDSTLIVKYFGWLNIGILSYADIPMLVPHWPILWGLSWDDELNDVGPKSSSTVEPTKYTMKTHH
jgi:hypothetical protein